MVACGWKCAGISEHGGERRGAADGCVQSGQRQLGPNVGGAAAAKAGSWRVDLGEGPLKHRPTFRKAPDRGFRITRFPFFLSEGEEQAARPCGRHRGLLGVTIQASQTFSPARILGLLRWSRLEGFQGLPYSRGGDSEMRLRPIASICFLTTLFTLSLYPSRAL
jgi:hypothetical protein